MGKFTVGHESDLTASDSRSAPERLRFSGFELDLRLKELRRDGCTVALRPKPLAVLVYLIEHRDRVVSKDELLERVWPDVVVGEMALTSAVRDLRRALRDREGGEGLIATRPGHGYRFMGAVGPLATATVVQGASSAGAAHGEVHGLPRGPSMSFVGRDVELARLEELLTKKGYVSVQASIEGLAGIGKTEVALQLAHKLAQDRVFPGGIFWLDAEDPDLRSIWGGALADRFGVRGDSADERCAQVLRRLAERREPMLIVLDNVAAWGSDAQPGPLPEGSHVQILITTRERNLGGPRFVHLELGFLSPPHDRALIEAVAARDPDPGLDALLAQLGGHALALELAGAFLATYPSESAESYLAMLLEDSDELEREAVGRIRYEQTVAASLHTMWVRLDEAEQQAWLVAACFEPEPASRALAEAAGLDARGRRALERRHLIRSTEDGRWAMHRLTRAFGQRSGSGTDRHEARRRFVQGCLDVVSSAGEAALARYLGDRPHCDAAVAMAAEVLDPGAELRILLHIGWPMVVQKGYAPEEVGSLFTRARRIARETAQHDAEVWASQSLWTHFVSRSRWASAGEIAASVRQLADEHGSPFYELVSHVMTGFVALNTGDWTHADAHLDRATAFLRTDSALRMVPSLEAAFMHSAIAKCVLGSPDRALALREECMRRPSGRLDPETLGLVYCIDATLHAFLADLDGVERAAASADEVAATHGLETLRRFPRAFLAWAAAAHDPSRGPAALDRILGELSELERLGFTMQRPLLAWLAVQLCIQLGAAEQGSAILDDALDLVEATGERMMESELWRCRAALTGDPAKRTDHLERAIEVAERQQAVWWSLRATLDLFASADSESSRARLLPRLRALHERLPAALDLPDLRRIREILAGASS